MNAVKEVTTVTRGAQTVLDLSLVPAMLGLDWLVTGERVQVGRSRDMLHTQVHMTTCPDINECSEGTHRCEQTCSNTGGSYTCSCSGGFTLGSDGRSCIANPTDAPCGGRLTEPSGSFQTDGWPNNYRQENFQCEWIIDLPDNGATIEFRIDDSAYGINGRPPCSRDHIEFFDGTATNSQSLRKICGHMSVVNLDDLIVTTSSEARVVFTGSVNRNRPASRVGVKVHYRTIPQQQGKKFTSNFL